MAHEERNAMDKKVTPATSQIKKHKKQRYTRSMGAAYANQKGDMVKALREWNKP